MRDADRCAHVTGINLSRVNTAADALNTRRYAHLRELASALPALPRDAEEAGDMLIIYRRVCEQASLQRQDRLILCSALAQRPGEQGYARRFMGITQPKRAPRVVYVKNPLTDIAYGQFCEKLSGARVNYAADFTLAAEDVYHGRADYVILPVESEKNGRMYSFARLSEKYELKKVGCCAVYSITEDGETTYALFSRNMEYAVSHTDGRAYLELSLDDPEDTLPSISAAAEVYGAHIDDVHTRDGKGHYTLDITDADRDALCVYLTLEMPRHTLTGLYG